MSRRRFIAGTLTSAGALCIGSPGISMAQNGGIARFVVPFAPGGSTDHLARLIAQAFSSISKRSYIVENKPGGSGLVAARDVFRAAPDGKAILPITPTFVISEYIRNDLPFSVVKDFRPIGMALTTPLILVVNAASDMHTLQDIKAFAENKKRPVTYSTAGIGSVPHLSMQELSLRSGIPMEHVPYKSGGESQIALLSNQVDVSLLTPVEIENHVQAGKMRPVASTGSKRTRTYPDIPTVAEAGIDNYEVIYFTGFSVRSSVPDETVLELSELLQKSLKEPNVIETLTRNGDIAQGTIAEAQDLLDKNNQLWARVVKEANLAESGKS